MQGTACLVRLGPARDDLWMDRRGERLRRPYAAEKQEQAAQEAAGWNPELKRAWEGTERKVETLSRQTVRTLKLLQELKALDEAGKDLQLGRRTPKNSQNESTSHQVTENKG